MHANPKSISWKITENCNSRCKTCIHWQTVTDNELTLEESKSLVDQCFKNGITRFRLTGGEPSLRNDLREIIWYIHRKGGKATVNSNLIDAKNIPLTVDNLFVALEGTPQTYKEIRGVDAYSRVLQNLTYFREYSKANIVASTILMKQTMRDLPALIETCRNLKIKLAFNLVDWSPYFFRGASKYVKDSLFEDYRKLSEHLISLYDPAVFFVGTEMLTKISLFYNSEEEAKMPCPIVLRNLKMGSRGDVYPGCWSTEPVGNVRNQSLTEILRSKNYRAKVESLFKHECDGCTCGWVQRVRYVMQNG